MEGRYWRCRWRAYQEQVGQSGQLTLVIKHTEELSHCVDECGEFSGFSFRGGSKGWSRQLSAGVEAAVP